MRLKKAIMTATAVLAAIIFGLGNSYACSRVVYLGDDNKTILVGRTLDWRTPIPTNIYVYPRGIAKQSMPSGPMLRWTSKYATTIAVGYDGGVTEGMNEKGLVMNGLFCKGSVYRTVNDTVPTDADIPVMSMSMYVSYFLDNFETVNEVSDWLAANDFAISGKTFDGGTVSLLHWALTDRSGQTLVMEYVNGKLATHIGRDLLVLTNDPPMPQMQAIDKYWEQVGGTNFLPGGVRSTDRFVRAMFFITHVPHDAEYNFALAELSSIMANVSVPYGYEIPGEPNVSSTQWRSIADLEHGRYYFRQADNIGDFYVDMQQLLLTPGSPILKLDTSDHQAYLGNANGHLKQSEGFNPMW